MGIGMDIWTAVCLRREDKEKLSPAHAAFEPSSLREAGVGQYIISQFLTSRGKEVSILGNRNAL